MVATQQVIPTLRNSFFSPCAGTADDIYQFIRKKFPETHLFLLNRLNKFASARLSIKITTMQQTKSVLELLDNLKRKNYIPELSLHSDKFLLIEIRNAVQFYHPFFIIGSGTRM